MKTFGTFPLSFAHTSLIAAFSALVIGVTSGCAALNDPNFYPSSNDGYYNNRGYDDDYYRRRESERNWEERRRLERERERLEEERRRHEYDRHRDPPPLQRPVPREESCPSGFSPSEQKCSPSERARGCKDIRMPSGLGCVRR
jgi:hypothetical protein